MRKELSISDVLSTTMNLIRKPGQKLWTLSLFFMLYFVALWASNAMGNLPKLWLPSSYDPNYTLPDIGIGYVELFSISIIGNILFTCIAWAVQVGLYGMLFAITRGEEPKVVEYKRPWQTYGKFILVTFLYWLAVGVGCLFCLVPGIYLAVRWQFAPMIMLEKPDCSISDAFARSYGMTDGNFWTLFGLNIVAYIITCLGFVACCVGVFFTGMFAMLASVVAYGVLKSTSGQRDLPVATAVLPAEEEIEKEEEKPIES